jgi:hypothetical protein
MSAWSMLLHVSGFLAPALAVGGVLAMVEWVARRKPIKQVAVAVVLYTLLAAAVLLLGLVLLGRDGKLLTYAALVLSLGAMAAWRNP